MRGRSSGAATAAALVAGALLLVVAACGGVDGAEPERSVEDVVAAVAGLSGPARTQKLEELAEAEGGELSLYTSMTSGHDSAVAEAFEEAHGVSVAIYRSSTEGVTQRLLEEDEAGFRGADIVESNGITMTVLAGRELLAGYESPSLSGLADGALRDGWT